MADKDFAKIEQQYIKELKEIGASNAKLLNSIKNKDTLIEELKARAEEAQEHDNTPYQCNKCGRPVHFNYVMAPIRRSGMCPSCYHD